MDALALLTGDARAFCEKAWASGVHLHSTAPAGLVSLLSLPDVDRLLTASALRTPAVRVVQDGSVLDPSQYTRPATLAGSAMTGLVDGRKVLALFDAGATVVLEGLHRYWPPLTRLVRDLELRLGHPGQANAYLTPPVSQGFDRHRDTHDVFVFQTHGRKHWEVADGDEERQVLLEPGLVMYLPTGTPHSARSQDETSLHVTLGVNPITWRELLRQVVDDHLGDREYDEPLPAGYLDDPEPVAERLGDRVARLAASLRSTAPAAVVERRISAFLTERPPALQGGLVDLVRLRSLDDETALARRPTAACVLRRHGDRLSVLLGDRELRMPVALEPVMEFVRDHPSFTVADLGSWLDQASRSVVARRLVREGLLRIAP